MKRITSIAFFALSILLAAGNASAQSYATEAKVPFDFTVGKMVLPAGAYKITSLSTTAILIRNEGNGRIYTQAMALPDNAVVRGSGELVFHRYGEQYFLSEVLCPAAAINVNLPVSKLEKRAQRNEASVRTPERVLLALSQPE